MGRECQNSCYVKLPSSSNRGFYLSSVEGRGTCTPWGKPGFAYFLHPVLCVSDSSPGLGEGLGGQQGEGWRADGAEQKGQSKGRDQPKGCSSPSPPQDDAALSPARGSSSVCHEAFITPLSV